MKKLSVISLLMLSLICSGAQANNQTGIAERGYISLSTTADAELVPDVAEISIAVKTYDNKSLQKATLQNKEISEKVISSLKSMINPNNGDYIKTADYNASPVYTYNNNKKTLDKYQVSNSVIIHTKSIDKVGSMIDSAIALGATNVNSLNFSLSSYENKCNELITIASQRAKDRANAALKVVPSSIAGIKSMDVSCSANNTSRPQYRMLKSNLMSAGASDAESSTAIEQGVIKIYANVNASYFVK